MNTPRLTLKKRMTAFTLIELLIVLAISMVVASVAFQARERDILYDRSKAAGEQINIVQAGFNSWINDHLNKLVTQPSWDVPVSYLINGQDPDGVSGSTKYLTSGFLNTNPWGSDYVLRVNRLGAAPNYSLQGLTVTRTPWVINGKTRLDLVGNAVRVAGGDSGMTYDATSGKLFGGTASFSNAEFPAINAPGQLLAQSGTALGSSTAVSSWKDPVATFTALPSIANTSGDARVVKDIAKAFTWDGLAWQPLAADQNGNLAVTGTVKAGKVKLSDVVVENTSDTTCNTTPSTWGLMATTSTGLTLSCQSGTWKKTESAWSASAANCTSNGYVYTGGSCKKIADFAVAVAVSNNQLWSCLYGDGMGSSNVPTTTCAPACPSSIDLRGDPGYGRILPLIGYSTSGAC